MSNTTIKPAKQIAAAAAKAKADKTAADKAKREAAAANKSGDKPTEPKKTELEIAIAETLASKLSVASGYRAQGLIKRLIGVKRSLKKAGSDCKAVETVIVELTSYRNKAAAAAAGVITSQWFCAVPKSGRVHGVGSYAKLK
jgi:hypothetical protein